jgi:DinB superfamily
MTDSEREFLLGRLEEGRDAFLHAIEGLSEAQLRFKPQQDGWSIAECIEHIAAAEDRMLGLIAKGAPNPQGISLDPEKDARMAAAVLDRRRKFSAPAQPAVHLRSTDDAIAQFHATRERSIAWTRACTSDLRRLFTMHPVAGEIDCYRCVLMLALHPARHAAQIEEIKRDPVFPRA